MAIADKLQQKLEKTREKLAEKSKDTENKSMAQIDSMEWLLLFLGAGYIDLLFIILTIIGLIPIVGQVIYVIADPALNLIATGIFWFYLQYKGLSGYWWLAFGGGVANLIPIVNWVGWIMAVLILYMLVKAEKIPLAGEAIQKAAKVASFGKIPTSGVLATTNRTVLENTRITPSIVQSRIPSGQVNESISNQPRRSPALYHDVKNDPEYQRMLQRWEVKKRLREWDETHKSE